MSGGKLFRITGVLVGMLGFLFDQFAGFLILALVTIGVACITTYSYFEYKKQSKY